MLKTITILVTVLLAAGSASAATTVLFNTFGPADTYDTLIGYWIGFDSSGNQTDYDTAFQFGFGGTASYPDRIELAVGLSAGTNELDVWLMSDVAGAPVALIEAFNFNGAMDL